MKSAIVFGLLLAAVVTATMLYAEKRRHSQDAEMETVVAGLRGVNEILPPGARVAFSCPNGDAPLYARCRYVLAPRYLAFVPGVHLDTALIITFSAAPDSAFAAITTNRKLLWQNRDSHYRYFLTCSP